MEADRNRAESPRIHPGRGIAFVLPALIWAGYFVVIYSAQGAACAAGEASRTLLGLLTLAAAAMIAAVGVWGYFGWRRFRVPKQESVRTPPTREAFLAWATITHAFLFFVATIWIGAATVFLDPCAGRIAGA